MTADSDRAAYLIPISERSDSRLFLEAVRPLVGDRYLRNGAALTRGATLSAPAHRARAVPPAGIFQDGK